MDDNELVVDSLPDVVEDTEIARLLGGQMDAELEARLAIRQKLPPLPAATSPAVDAPMRFGDGNPLTDMDCVIPEDQERELDEQDGWGPPPAAHSRPLPTDSQLIDENGSVPMSELQDTSFTSDSGERGCSARSEAGGASASFPIEPTSPNTGGASQVDGSAVAKRHGQLSGSETEDEYETRNSLEGNDSDNDEPHGSPGSVDVPIDLTGDEDDDPPEYESQALSRADYIYDDSELFTQPPDASAGFQQTQEKSWFQSQEEKEASQTGRSWSDSETQVLDDPRLSTQLSDAPADQSLEAEAHETRIDDETQLPEAQADTTNRPRQDQDDEVAQPSISTQAQDVRNDMSALPEEAQDVRKAQQAAETQPLNEDDDALAHLHDVQVSQKAKEGEDALMDATILPSDARDNTSDHSLQAQDGQELQADAGTLLANAQGKAHAHDSSEDANINQPRGLGSFFRRLASNLGMVSSRRESTDRPSGSSPSAKDNSAEAGDTNKSGDFEAQVSRNGEVSAADNTVSIGNSDNSQSDNGQSQNPDALADVEMWQTQAPEVVDSSDGERPPSPASSPAPDYGYEQDVEDVEMTTDSVVAAATSAPRVDVARVSVDASQVSDDEDHAEESAGASARTPPTPTPHQTPATMGKKRSLRESGRDEAMADFIHHGARQISSPAAPSARVPSSSSPTSPVTVDGERQAESAHNQQRAGDNDEEEAKEDEQSSARKRRRLGRVLELPSPRRRSSTSMQTTSLNGLSNYALSPSSDRSWARLGLGDSPSTAARAPVPAPAHIRPSKRFEAFFPPLRMDRIMQLIAEKKE